MTTKKKEPKQKKEFERTIEQALFEAWQEKRRTTDVKDLMALTGKSDTIIYRALQFGHVKNEELSDIISNFYIERTQKQQMQANLINGKNEENEQRS